MLGLPTGAVDCRCRLVDHEPKRIAITGGPGAGKTAILEMAKQMFCEHVAILPEAAGIVFGGGFPRNSSESARRAAQGAIYHVQRMVEQLAEDERSIAVALCDRGTVDGAAYWPGDRELYCTFLGTSLEAELERYSAVIHMQTPLQDQGYDHSNELRVESADEAKVLDQRILEAWKGHPQRTVIPSSSNFLDKASRALLKVRDELPRCCQTHPLPW
tara:strand:+ start:18799 stop:19446 length:648 start_codon:yes stop_codon:yes gene_type:complete